MFGSEGGKLNYTIFFTNQCNMDCSYCYENNKKTQSISHDTIDNTINFIVKQYFDDSKKDVSVVTHGGEPLVAFEKIRYFIERLNSKIKNVKYIITTNATLFNDEIIDFLVENYSEISISIDGTKKVHDANRIFANGQGTYDIVVQNAKKLLYNHSDVKARMTINPRTVSYVFESVKHLLELGFTTIVPVPDAFCNDWTQEDMTILYEQGKSIIDYIKEYPNITNVGLINDSLAKKANAPCNGGSTTFSVDTDGTIYPCIVAVGTARFKIGNVVTDIDMNKVKEISEWDNIKIQSCIGCSRYDYCNTTRCRIINNIMCGELHTPSPSVCNIENVKVRLSEYYMTVFSSPYGS